MFLVTRQIQNNYNSTHIFVVPFQKEYGIFKNDFKEALLIFQNNFKHLFINMMQWTMLKTKTHKLAKILNLKYVIYINIITN